MLLCLEQSNQILIFVFDIIIKPKPEAKGEFYQKVYFPHEN